MATTLWPANGTYTGRQLRQTLGAFWGSLTNRPLGARSGVVAGTPTGVVSMSGSTYTIGRHRGVLDVETAVEAGPYNYSVDAAFTGTVNPADSSNPRIDLVSVTMSDPGEGDATLTGPVFTYTPGTPLATPVQPATPAASSPFARISVPRSGNGSPTITLIAPYTVAAGGVLPCRSSADYPANPYVGQYVDDAALGLLRWDGSAWRTVGGANTDWAAITLAANYQASSGFVPQVRRINGVVYFRGRVERTDGQNIVTGTPAPIAGGGVPAGFRPAASTDGDRMLSTGIAASPCRGAVQTDGSVIFIVPVAVPFINLAGLGPYPAA